MQESPLLEPVHLLPDGPAGLAVENSSRRLDDQGAAHERARISRTAPQTTQRSSRSSGCCSASLADSCRPLTRGTLAPCGPRGVG
jgi:hypothetical protein